DDNPLDRGFAAAEVVLWDEAAKAFGKAIERQKDDANLHRLYAQCLLGSGDVDGYRRQCKHMLDQFGSTTDPGAAWVFEAACSLSPAGITDPTRLVQFADMWLKAGHKESWRMFHVGLAHYRAGKFREALRYFELAESSGHAWASTLMAMAHHRLGHADEARRWLAKADGSYNSSIPDAGAGTPAKFYHDWVWGPILWREAKELIEGKPPPADPRLRLVRARAYSHLGQLKKAEAEYQAAIDLQPEDASLWITRGRFHAERGNHKKADADFAKAASLTPNELNKFLEGGWWVVGPYPRDLKIVCPPEIDPDPARPVSVFGPFPVLPTGAPFAGLSTLGGLAAPQLNWVPCKPAGHGLVISRGHPALDKQVPNVSLYALTYVYSPDERSV